jgi:hypothetical protein
LGWQCDSRTQCLSTSSANSRENVQVDRGLEYYRALRTLVKHVWAISQLTSGVKLVDESTTEPFTRERFEKLQLLTQLGEKSSFKQLAEIIQQHPEHFGELVDFRAAFLHARSAFIANRDQAIKSHEDSYAQERLEQFEPDHSVGQLERMLIDLVATTDLRAEAFAHHAQRQEHSEKTGMAFMNIANKARAAATAGLKALEKHRASDASAKKNADQTASDGPAESCQ